MNPLAGGTQGTAEAGRAAGCDAAGGATAPAGLPCPQVTTAPDLLENLRKKLAILPGSARRSAYAFQQDVIAMTELWGINNVLFVTLTFGGGKRGPTVKQAEKAFHSFLTHGLGARFKGGAKILERGDKNGRVHFHLLVNAGKDVRSGSNFAAFDRGDYSTVSPECRRAYGWLRENAVKYGFGRIVNCMPIKSSAEGAARYVSKYISKHFGKRRPEDKGARLRAYWGCASSERRCTCRFSWAGEHGERGWLWRQKLRQFAGRLGYREDNGAFELWVRQTFGARWAFHLSPTIMAEVLNYYPTEQHYHADGGREDDGAERVPVLGRTEVLSRADTGIWRLSPPGLSFRERVEAAGRRIAEQRAAREVDRTIIWSDGRVERVNQAFIQP